MIDSTRRWTLPGTAGSYLVARAGERPAPKGWSRLPAVFVRAALERAIASGTSVVYQLHEAVGGARTRRSGLSREAYDGHRRAIARSLESAFRSGELLAFRRDPPPAADLAEAPPAPEREYSPEGPIAEVAESFITIQLAGEDGAGIPGMRYRVLLPSRTIREGTLDGSGTATVRGKFSGTCKVSFPELDANAWEPV